MPRLITLSRAARLVGVKRGTLQEKIQQGELRTFEGELLLADLLHAYPQTQVEDTTMLERVGHIMEQAVNKIVRPDEDMPDYNTLAARILSLGRELAQAQAGRPPLPRTGRRPAAEAGRTWSAAPTNRRPRHWASCRTGCNRHSRPPRRTRTTRRTSQRRHCCASSQPRSAFCPSGHEFFIEGSDSILEAGTAQRPGAELRLQQRQLRSLQGQGRIRPGRQGS